MKTREKELRKLIDVMRVDLGFMIYDEDEENIIDTKVITSEEFATKILQAEDLDPEFNLKLFRQVRNKFREKFGSQI
jgi:hypothetical protein